MSIFVWNKSGEQKEITVLAAFEFLQKDECFIGHDYDYNGVLISCISSITYRGMLCDLLTSPYDVNTFFFHLRQGSAKDFSVQIQNIDAVGNRATKMLIPPRNLLSPSVVQIDKLWRIDAFTRLILKNVPIDFQMEIGLIK